MNETVGFEFALQSGEEVIRHAQLRVRPTPNTAAHLTPESVQIYRRHAVPVEGRPGWHVRYVKPGDRASAPLDALVPLSAPRGGWVTEIPARSRMHFWADVMIPRGTPPGIHEFDIDLVTARKLLATLHLQIEVWPFVLPDESVVAVIAEVDHRELFRHHVSVQGRSYAPPSDDWRQDARADDLNRVLRSTLALLRQHGLTPVLPFLEPAVRLNARGRLEVDWAAYDAVVAPLLDGAAFPDRTRLRHWPMPFASRLHSGMPATLTEPSDHRWPVALMEECARHFREREWHDRWFLRTDFATEPTPKDIDRLRAVRDWRERARSTVPLASTLWPQDLSALGWTKYPPWGAETLVDIWMPPAQFFDPDAFRVQREAGRRTWLRVDRPPFSGTLDVRAPAGFARILPWQAARLEADVVYLDTVNRWPPPDANPAPGDCARVNPSALLYPGRAFGLDTPVATKRLKELRRGQNDLALVKLLRDLGGGHVADAVLPSVVRRAGASAYHTSFADGGAIDWVTDHDTLEDARTILANEALRRIEGATPAMDPYEAFAENASWRRFMLKTRALRVEPAGVRLRPARGSTAYPIALESFVTLTNHTRVPVSGRLSFLQPSPDWVLDEEEPAMTVARGAGRLAAIRAGLRGLTPMPHGIANVPMSYTTDSGTIISVDARVACLLASSLEHAVTIDGDLSDWPLAAGNVAGSFRLIAGHDPHQPPNPSSAPRRRTLAFVGVYDSDLLIAINGEAAPDQAVNRPRRNTILYDDLIPLGEDLVELLFDPLNSGSRSPADLYHVAVKRTGVVLTHRGVRTDPPCGLAADWPAGIEAAVRDFGDRWTAELRIPLISFEPALTRRAIWGFNVTRFDPQAEEFSTWSGAVRNAYDPLSLGNLYLP